MTDEAARRFGFPRAARLIRSADFGRVMRGGGRRSASEHFVVFSAPSPTGRSRLGLTVSRKVGPAVRRNRIKRYAREVFRGLAPSFQRPVDLVVLARKKASFAEISFAETRRELERCFIHLGLLDRSSARG